MFRTAVLVASLLTGQAHAEKISCATLIALGKPTTEQSVIIGLRLDMSIEWTKVTTWFFNDHDLGQVIVGCVAHPEASVAEVMRHVSNPL